MGTGNYFLGLFCTAFIGLCGVSGSGVVALHGSRDLSVLRDDVIRVAIAEVGVREKTGRNDGKRVEEYLAYVGFKKGNPYCAAFVSWCFWKAGYSEPRTAWSPSLFPKGRVTSEALKGLVFGIYFPELKRIAHVGFVERLQGNFIQTIEGNTSPDGGREGVGVFRRLRHRRTICRYADWL